MSKRGFRPKATEKPAGYPTLREFDSTRRQFLGRLAAAAAAAAGLAGLLSACGDRPVGDDEEDPEPRIKELGGVAPPREARVDQVPRHLRDLGGAAPPPDARIDAGPPPRPSLDATGGVAPAMDSRADTEPKKGDW